MARAKHVDLPSPNVFYYPDRNGRPSAAYLQIRARRRAPDRCQDKCDDMQPGYPRHDGEQCRPGFHNLNYPDAAGQDPRRRELSTTRPAQIPANNFWSVVVTMRAGRNCGTHNPRLVSRYANPLINADGIDRHLVWPGGAGRRGTDSNGSGQEWFGFSASMVRASRSSTSPGNLKTSLPCNSVCRAETHMLVCRLSSSRTENHPALQVIEHHGASWPGSATRPRRSSQSAH